jgi:hypothetical protein
VSWYCLGKDSEEGKLILSKDRAWKRAGGAAIVWEYREFGWRAGTAYEKKSE